MPARGPFQERLGYTFKQPELLELALTHPSVSHEQGEKLANNQRLEFLGDAVLQLIISRATAIQLGPELVLSRGEEINNGRERPSALADAFEALVGAIYLDGGFTKVKRFIHTEFTESLTHADAGRHTGNPKGELQEILQGKNAVAPEYRLLEMEGPDHDRS